MGSDLGQSWQRDYSTVILHQRRFRHTKSSQRPHHMVPHRSQTNETNGTRPLQQYFGVRHGLALESDRYFETGSCPTILGSC